MLHVIEKYVGTSCQSAACALHEILPYILSGTLVAFRAAEYQVGPVRCYSTNLLPSKFQH